MKVAITAQGQGFSSMIDPRFGRARWILVVDTETGEYQAHDNTVHLNAPQGAGIQTAQNIANLGVEAVITGNVGPNAFRVLNAANIKVFLAAQQTVEQAVAAFKEGRLQDIQQANVEGHWA
ncbi:MAG: NifB/NifX family molybdenum-iron cluster-binding protein [Phycisphaerae bacterium]|nr:NifB/NifX family molybdenum-iron cluster-binding protein [Phycisphaerae bacterium]